MLAYTSATSGWRRMNRPWTAKRAEAPRLGRLVDHPQRDPVGHVADDHAEDRQQPPEGDEMGERRDRDPEHEAEEEAEVLDELELAAAHVEEHAVGELGIEALDHHQLDVDELVDVARRSRR